MKKQPTPPPKPPAPPTPPSDTYDDFLYERLRHERERPR